MYQFIPLPIQDDGLWWDTPGIFELMDAAVEKCKKTNSYFRIEDVQIDPPSFSPITKGLDIHPEMDLAKEMIELKNTLIPAKPKNSIDPTIHKEDNLDHNKGKMVETIIEDIQIDQQSFFPITRGLDIHP